MRIPLSWLKEFIDLRGMSVEDIARKLTLAGLEVEEIRYVGWPMPDDAARGMHSSGRHEFKTTGISWDREKIVVAEVREVNSHPNADRLTLLDLFDGVQSQVVLTGAPNIFHLKGSGRLPTPLKVAYAKEGATIYDGHAEGLQFTTLKRAKIRGVESYSMACSEKELGISEDHEGILLLDADAPAGMPLADYMGDAVFDIAILPNMARNANVIGVARELAAMTGRKLKQPSIKYRTSGQPVEELVSIDIMNPELNPRFVIGLIRDVEIKPSPYQVQRRLKLAGIRPINCIVDATNYAMLELGEPLHAFDYDILKERAGRNKVKMITRTAKQGEKLTTLDGVDRSLTSMNVLVCDEKGPLSLAGVMGGVESEVHDASKEVLDAQGVDRSKLESGKLHEGKISLRGRSTTDILLEGAAWNFINIRRTAKQHNLPSEASFRFSRGVHPSLAEIGLKRGLQYMAMWSGGKVAPGLVDAYPLKPKDPNVTVTPSDVRRLLGIELSAKEIAALLTRLEFKCTVERDKVRAKAPPHRMDIGEGVVGLADVLEEVARSYGYDRIPTTTMADALPPQAGNPVHEWEEILRDRLVALGLQEIVSYRMTSIERESRLAAHDSYARIANPITPERSVLRRSLLASVLEAVERNARAGSLALFEIGPVFEPQGEKLPIEPRRLAIVMTGRRLAPSWDVQESPALDFYYMKGRLELLLAGLHLCDFEFAETKADYLHPGKSAVLRVDGKALGSFGELHPRVKEKYDLGDAPVIVGEFDLDRMCTLHPTYGVKSTPDTPPIFEDIALIVDESIPAAKVEALIRQTGGKILAEVRLFDVYRGDQIGTGKKSLAYNLTYQSDATMTDSEAAAVRNQIVKRLENEIGAKLRG